jgi:hypothetical protein
VQRENAAREIERPIRTPSSEVGNTSTYTRNANRSEFQIGSLEKCVSSTSSHHLNPTMFQAKSTVDMFSWQVSKSDAHEGNKLSFNTCHFKWK